MAWQFHMGRISADLRRFFSWWGRELSVALPPDLVEFLLGDQRRIVIRMTSERTGASLVDSRNGLIEAEYAGSGSNWTPVEAWHHIRSAAAVRPVVLELPSSLVLTQDLRLPRVAINNLAATLRHSLSTWSPFAFEDVYVAATIGDLDASHGSVTLHYALRSQVAPLLERAAASGLPVDRIDFGNGAHVDRLTPKQVRARRGRRIDAALAASALVLIILAAGGLWWRGEAHLARLNELLRTEIAALRQQEAMENRISATVARRGLVMKERAIKPTLGEVLGHVAAALPATAAVIAIELEQSRGRMEIEGASIDLVVRPLSEKAILTGISGADVAGGPAIVNFTLAGAGQP